MSRPLRLACDPLEDPDQQLDIQYKLLTHKSISIINLMMSYYFTAEPLLLLVIFL